ARAHPTRTGPYKFESWRVGEAVKLTANEDYWGEDGAVPDITFRVIDDPVARRQALEAGDIDGYALVAPADASALSEAG
ncbi:ABC transporter substrate-binding protein, partial [Micrococcus sp. SIMBA_131]